MKARPTIFLSGVSHEFGSFRDAVEIEIQKKGCFAENQSSFAPDYHTVEEMLRRRLKDSDAVIHIAGFRFGAEPNRHPADKPRRSYTQMEFLIAREMQKPVFVFLSADSSVRDLAKPDEQWENTETLALQQAHRQAVQNTNQLYYFFKDRSELCKLVAEIPVLTHAGEFNASIGLHQRFGAHKVDELRNLLRTLADPLLKEGFVLAAFVQISAAIPDVVAQDRSLDLALVNILAERQSPHELLCFVKACEVRSKALGLEGLSRALGSWFSEALSAFNAAQGASRTERPNAPDAQMTEVAVMGRCGEALSFLESNTFPHPTLEIAWRPDATAPGKQVVPEAYVRWGRYWKQVSLGTLASVTADEGPTRLVLRIRNSKQFQHVRFDRLDIFVSREELNRPWEYFAGCKPDDEDAQLLPWPSVVRLLGRELVFGETRPPPDPVNRQCLACWLGQCDTFMAEVRDRGAFFAARAEDENVALVLGRAAARASLGFWIRTTKPIELAEECLNALEGMAFATIPLRVFKRKVDSPKHSAWRDMAVLYDHPEWPAFEFSEDQFQLSDHEQMLRAVT